jgi:TFIIF-interacting CTD phosphatase-like protein
MRDVRRARRKRRRRPHDDIEANSYSSSSDSESERYSAARRGDKSGISNSRRSRKRVYLERSLRPRNHQVTVCIDRRCEDVNWKEQRADHGHGTVHQRHGVKVTRTSRFAHKGSGRRADRARERERS